MGWRSFLNRGHSKKYLFYSVKTDIFKGSLKNTSLVINLINMGFLEIIESIFLFAVPISMLFMRSLSIKIYERRGDSYARYSPLETSVHAIPIPLFAKQDDNAEIISLLKRRNFFVYAMYSFVGALILIEILKQI